MDKNHHNAPLDSYQQALHMIVLIDMYQISIRIVGYTFYGLTIAHPLGSRIK